MTRIEFSLFYKNAQFQNSTTAEKTSVIVLFHNTQLETSQDPVSQMLTKF